MCAAVAVLECSLTVPMHCDRDCKSALASPAIGHSGTFPLLDFKNVFTSRLEQTTVKVDTALVDNSFKRISLAWSRSVQTQCSLKYKTWISGYCAQVDTHNQVPVLST